MFASAYTGIAAGAVRLVLIVPTGLLALMRLDEDVFPVWVGRYLLLDTSHRAFEAALLVYHRYNHPVMLVFKTLVLEQCMEQRARGRGAVSVD